MYTLSIGLDYEHFLQLNSKYRYDFLAINPEPGFGFGPLNGSVFVFRTIKDSYLRNNESLNNVLIDVVDYKNLNAFDTALHGDCHFHFLDINNIKDDEIVITNNISIKNTKDETGVLFFAITKNQKIQYVNTDNPEDSIIKVKDLKHILFKLNNQAVFNCHEVELAKIFELESKHIWHNNRYHNFNNLGSIDIDKNPHKKLEDSTSWKKIKEIVNENRNYWGSESRKSFDDLLNKKRSFNYEILD
ncbi:hypothetical protein phiCT453B_26 (endogenous virus) [Clostridium phage phiCT453B]|uniref:hypothetical protein n=1 Tax=Clostridium phage phiCT453B TaxID=1567013 RepID=UPI0005146A10|nr:hypothetical protein [Clostridium tetani]YP_009217922.1 hypothetical protein phiCT453B_26 [Clostridium phage phiCT453B]AJA42578.1 hypothetical protein phiCT453B_26 [Clostridium phage phiCT453B]KGI45299.1 hypothetical protein KY55_01305 [Clostridium tetani]